MAGIVPTREDRKNRKKGGRIAPPGFHEAHGDGRIILDVRVLEFPEQQLGERMTLTLQYVQREDDILCRQRSAVMKPKTVAQEETIGQTVARHLNGAGSKTVQGVRLVEGARHQAGE